MDTFRLTYPEWLRIEFLAYPLVLFDSNLVLRARHLDLDTYIHLPLPPLKIRYFNNFNSKYRISYIIIIIRYFEFVQFKLVNDLLMSILITKYRI